MERNLFSGVMPYTWHSPVEKIFRAIHTHQQQRKALVETPVSVTKNVDHHRRRLYFLRSLRFFFRRSRRRYALPGDGLH